jgi:RNA polymerase sigma-70 factor (ECF subfamily)
VSYNYQSLEEGELISLCKSHEDLKAFDELASRNSNLIKYYLISRFKDHCKAQEVLQITLIKAWKNIKKYEGKSKFVSWLNRIAHNTYYDHVRKLKRESSLDEMKERAAAHGQGGVDNGYVDNYLGLTDDDPHRPIKLKELNNKLTKVISMLSKDHEQVIKMKEIEDLSCKEISLKINCPYPTVCTRLFYARKKAKEILTRLSNE